MVQFGSLLPLFIKRLRTLKKEVNWTEVKLVSENPATIFDKHFPTSGWIKTYYIGGSKKKKEQSLKCQRLRLTGCNEINTMRLNQDMTYC